MPERPFHVPAKDYPFASRWMSFKDVPLHYVDEGRGIPLVMLHGNPAWSFLYRNVILGLRDQCRCVAPDYPGFGFSGHPAGYGYTPQEQAEAVEALLDRLGLETWIPVVHDWGGPIGLSAAVRRPERVAGVLLLNTWCWRPDWNMRVFSWVMGGYPWGRYLQLKRNFFARRMVRLGVRRKDAPEEIFRAYTAPFPTPASRMGTYVFPRAIRLSADWLHSIEQCLETLRDRPAEMVWAMRDPAFGGESILARWRRRFPEARIERLPNASHYTPEEDPEAVIQAARRLLARV